MVDWVTDMAMRMAILETHRAVRRIPGAMDVIAASLEATDAEHVPGESNYRVVDVPGFGRVATVINKAQRAYVVDADVFADYLIERFAVGR